jgi:hypothetical protein
MACYYDKDMEGRLDYGKQRRQSQRRAETLRPLDSPELDNHWRITSFHGGGSKERERQTGTGQGVGALDCGVVVSNFQS